MTATGRNPSFDQAIASPVLIAQHSRIQRGKRAALGFRGVTLKRPSRQQVRERFALRRAARRVRQWREALSMMDPATQMPQHPQVKRRLFEASGIACYLARNYVAAPRRPL